MVVFTMEALKKEGIDALVIIGGDGSLTGARIFAQELMFHVSDCRELLIMTFTVQILPSDMTLH